MACCQRASLSARAAVAQLGHKGFVHGPVRRQLVGTGPKAGGQPRQVGGAQCRGLGHLRAHHGHAQKVGLHLHQQVVARRTAVHPQFLERNARVLCHRRKHIGRLQRDGLQRRAGDVGARGAAGHADQRATGKAIPMRRAQAGEGGHQIHVLHIRHAAGQGLDGVGRRNDLQAIAQPLDGGAAHEDRALQRVASLARSGPTHATVVSKRDALGTAAVPVFISMKQPVP